MTTAEASGDRPMGPGLPSVLVDAAADHGTLSLWGADSTEPAILACAPDRAEVGATVLPVDDETVVRFLAKCSPTDAVGIVGGWAPSMGEWTAAVATAACRPARDRTP